MNTKPKDSFYERLTVLFKRRSEIALCCGILTLLLAFYGIISVLTRTMIIYHENGFLSFSYYTIVSYMLAALSAAFGLPHIAEGIRKKRFILPKWVSVTHFMATVTLITMMFFVLPFMDESFSYNPFGEPNPVTHVLCPILILICFFQMESGNLFTWKDRLLGIIPFFLYLIVYLIEVAVAGAKNGGWQGIDQFIDYIFPSLAAFLTLIPAFGISIAIALVSNHLTKKYFTEKQ